MTRPEEKAEPRWPAILIWTITGTLLGFAVGLFVELIWLTAVGALGGLAYGLVTTRPKAPNRE
jgi:hypothetical protein